MPQTTHVLITTSEFGEHSVLTIALMVVTIFPQLGGNSQPMGPRPGMGMTTPRAMPPYKYATAIRNTQPQVVQPITLQQVICRHILHININFTFDSIILAVQLFLSDIMDCIFNSMIHIYLQRCNMSIFNCKE